MPTTNKLLRTITGRRHTKTCHELFAEEAALVPSEFAALDLDNTGTISIEEWTARFGSEEGFAEYDANTDGGIDQQEFLQAKQMLAVAGLVKDALGEGWANVEAKDIQVNDNSGFGGSTCYKVSALGATPEAVALHSRSVTAVADTVGEGMTEAAGMLFSQHGLGPTRLAQGADWNIEPWEGSGAPVMDSVQKFEMLGRLLAQIHQLPTDWHDEWKEKICARQPYLQDCHHGHYLKRIATDCENRTLVKEVLTSPRVKEILASTSKEHLFPPVTAAGRRVVTVHGDFHQKNVIQMADSMRAIDFDCTSVAYAVIDLTYVICWVDQKWFGDDGLSGEELLERKRGFMAAYLSTMGESANAEDVDALLLDAQLGVYQCFWPGISSLPTWTAEGASGLSEADFNAIHSAVGITSSEAFTNVQESTAIGAFVNFWAGPFNAKHKSLATFFG